MKLGSGLQSGPLVLGRFITSKYCMSRESFYNSGKLVNSRGGWLWGSEKHREATFMNRPRCRTAINQDIYSRNEYVGRTFTVSVKSSTGIIPPKERKYLVC